MGEIWIQMGFIRYPMAAACLVIVAVTLWSSAHLFGGQASADMRTKAWVDAILFWGGFAMITGVLGTLVGVIVAAQSIEAAQAVSTPLVWGGIKVAMLSSAFGFLIVALASLAWFGLQMRWRLLRARSVPVSG